MLSLSESWGSLPVPSHKELDDSYWIPLGDSAFLFPVLVAVEVTSGSQSLRPWYLWLVMQKPGCDPQCLPGYCIIYEASKCAFP